MNEQAPAESNESTTRKSRFMRELETDIYWGIGAAAFRDPCGVNIDPPRERDQPKLEDIKDGYQVSFDFKTGEITTKQIRNGQIIEPPAEPDL